jgi:acetoin utilization deacetylase AcuC-like enzyme
MDSLFIEHSAGRAHPECPERLIAVYDALRQEHLVESSTPVGVRPASLEELTRVHTPAHVERLEREVSGRSGWLDADTFYSPRTWEAALGAAGGTIDLVVAAVRGDVQRGAALVRPPGHHAESDRAMGFCLINNAACAAAAARVAGAERVAIVDWDVHHGNGTQEIFWSDPSVLFISTHQYPFYPGTGAPDEVGQGPGAGATVNLALPAGCGDADYLAAFDQVVLPELRRFEPELILVSAGFDAFARDPLAAMNVSVAGFAAMARRLRRAAEDLCGGKLVAILEGGYDLRGLSDSVVAVLQEMMSVEPAAASEPVSRGPIADGAIAATRAALLSCRGGTA